MEGDGLPHHPSPSTLIANAMHNSDTITSNRLRCSLRSVIGLNFALLVVAIGVGLLTATISHATIDPASGLKPAAVSTLFGEFRFIATWNLRVMGIIVLGVCTLGVFSAIEFAWLGFSFGMDVFTVAHSWPKVLGLFLCYAPIEVSAFCLAASASQFFSISVVRCLFLREPLRVRGAILTLTVAIAMLMVADFIEAHAAQTIRQIVQITDGRSF
jgi:uncharacterized membrane protein SpoIIM required for sporulation